MIKNDERHTVSLYYLLGLLFFVLLIFQRMQWFSLKIGNAYPILLLPAVLAVSCFLGEWVGFWYGLGCGIALDTMAGRSAVFNTIMFTLIAVAAGLVYHYLFNRNVKSALVGGFIFTIIYYLTKWLFLYVAKNDASSLKMLTGYILPSAIYTAFLTVPVYFLIKWIIKHHVI